MSASSTVTNNFDTQIPFEGEKPSKEEMIRQVNGHLWRCIDYHEGILTFTLKDKFKPRDKGDKKNALERMSQVSEKIYPATEPTPSKILELANFDYYKKSRIQLIINTLFQTIYEWIDGKEKKPAEIVEDQKIISGKIEILSENQELAQEFSSLDPFLGREEFSQALQMFTKKLKAALLITVDDYYKNNKRLRDFFNQLGFSSKKEQGTVFFTMPCAQELQERWKTIQLNHPHLPELSIYSSQGIAGDLEFVEAYLSHHVLISTGGEMVHDSGHLFDMLGLIYIDYESYSAKKSSIVREAKKIYEKIIFAKQHLTQMGEASKISKFSIQKLEVSLGMAMDLLSTFKHFKETIIECEEDFHRFIEYIWTNSFRNRTFFQNRLGGDRTIEFPLSEIQEILKSIDTLMQAV